MNVVKHSQTLTQPGSLIQTRADLWLNSIRDDVMMAPAPQGLSQTLAMT